MDGRGEGTYLCTSYLEGSPPVGGVIGAAFHGAAKKDAEELVQVSKEHARLVSLLD